MASTPSGGDSAAPRKPPAAAGGLYAALRRRRARLDRDLARRGLSHTFSLTSFRLHLGVSELIDRHASGECLDVGAGQAPYRRRLEARAARVTSLDVEDRSGGTDLIADVEDMRPVADGSFDTVLCTQVLEHVPRPWRALSEIARVLRPGGCLIASVPHLSMIHEPPRDFFRFTRFGLASLLREAGFEAVEIRPTGGMICFLSHGASLALTGTLGAVPGLRWPVWLLNYLLLVRLGDLADRLLGAAGIYPCDYVLAARKPSPVGAGAR